MGLDWLPGDKPKPGHEREFDALWRAVHSRFCFGRKRKQRQLDTLGVSLHETLATPEVGKDATADDWVRSKFAERKDAALTLSQWELQFRGFRVLDLVPPCDGLPRYSNGGPGQYIDASSFRGQFLESCKHIIGAELLHEAYEPKLAAATRTYGERLLERATVFAQARVINLASVHNATDPDSSEFQLDVVLTAARWCRFWGDRGHWLCPWF